MVTSPSGHRVVPVPIESVTELISEWAPVAREASRQPPERPWREAVDLDGHPLASTEEELRRLTAALHLVFLTDTPDGRRAALNELIALVEPMPFVDGDGPGWIVADESKVGIAGLVYALWEHATIDPDLERLGTCQAARCLDAYVDTTQAGTRRYCSAGCQNRAKVAAYRRRHPTPR